MKRQRNSKPSNFQPSFNTKVVATIGPASASADILKRMVQAGMSVARLNFSHGEFASHSKIIDGIRAVAKSLGLRVTIMADFPGPKIRIGTRSKEEKTGSQISSGGP